MMTRKELDLWVGIFAVIGIGALLFLSLKVANLASFSAADSYQVNAKLFDHAQPDAIFMHCLPAHRGEEVSADVMDSSASIVFDQAENRIYTQKAILYLLLLQPDSAVA